MATVCGLATRVEERLLARNRIVEEFFSREAPRLAEACRSMSERFLKEDACSPSDAVPTPPMLSTFPWNLFIP